MGQGLLGSSYAAIPSISRPDPARRLAMVLSYPCPCCHQDNHVNHACDGCVQDSVANCGHCAELHYRRWSPVKAEGHKLTDHTLCLYDIRDLEGRHIRMRSAAIAEERLARNIKIIAARANPINFNLLLWAPKEF